jgi:uncharacterized membrane protein YagU involved in acid resistance
METHDATDPARPAVFAAAGLAGGLLGSLAMNLFSRIMLSAGGGREADGAAPGADRTGRGVQPPQAEATAEDDATVRAGKAVYRAATGREASPRAGHWLGTAAHYAFGGIAGTLYGLLADRAPGARAAHGAMYGTLVWALADEGVMPALGLSRGPRRLSPAVHAYALAGHIVYGAVLESAVQALTREPAPPDHPE